MKIALRSERGSRLVTSEERKDLADFISSKLCLKRIRSPWYLDVRYLFHAHIHQKYWWDASSCYLPNDDWDAMFLLIWKEAGSTLQSSTFSMVVNSASKGASWAALVWGGQETYQQEQLPSSIQEKPLVDFWVLTSLDQVKIFMIPSFRISSIHLSIF